MPHVRSIFDVLGPIMIGPSSSHTAGAVRLGRFAREAFGAMPTHVRIALHGSFATTGRGHGTDIALVAGLLGMEPDDHDIPSSLERAADSGLTVEFAEEDLGAAHPNTARIDMQSGDRSLSVQGSSVGGADIAITRIGEFEVEAAGELPLLLVAHVDRPGEIAAVTGVLADSGANIAAMRVSRTRRGADALMLIETDAPVDDATVARIEAAPSVTAVRRIAPV